MTTIIKTGHVQQRLKMHRMMPSTSGRMQGAIRNVAFTKASSNRFYVFLFPPYLNIVLNIVLVRVAVLLPCIGDPAHYWSGRSWLCMERTVTAFFFLRLCWSTPMSYPYNAMIHRYKSKTTARTSTSRTVRIRVRCTSANVISPTYTTRWTSLQ